MNQATATSRWVGPLVLKSHGKHPAPGPHRTECYVYEVYDIHDRLVYVGIAGNFHSRWRQHERQSFWLNEVVLGYVNVYGYRTRWEAQQQEAWAINVRNPIYNTRLETSAYEAYLGLENDPTRPIDDMDCISVSWSVYEPTGWAF